MGCGASGGPYPATIPDAAKLPTGVTVLDPKEKGEVEQAISVCARSFVGTATVDPPWEFHWLLSDVPDRADPDGQRIHRLSAMMAFCVHYAFVLGDRGLVLIARKPDAPKIVGCAVVQFYPKGWTPSTDGSMAQMKAYSNCGGSKWTKEQNGFMDGGRMKALDKAVKNLHKTHASAPHIFIQIVAVDPDEQGQGLGKLMLEAVNAIGDALSLPVYLECDGGSKNEAVYTKMGYAVAGKEELVLKVKGKEDEAFANGMNAMRREPAKA